MQKVQQLGLQIKGDYCVGSDKSSVTPVWDNSSVCMDQSSALGPQRYQVPLNVHGRKNTL